MFQNPKIHLVVTVCEIILSKRPRKASRGRTESMQSPRVKWKKAWNEEGVAATVGTILSLMVFLTFLGMFTNQYVPIWMKDNENNHMNQVIGQMSALKSSIDMQIISAQSNVANAPIYSPIQLQANGVPIFASPTIGSLSFTSAKISTGANASLSYNYTAGSGSSVVHQLLNNETGAQTGGSIEFYGPNRYFVAQSVIYENGAIILNQSNGEVVLAGISIKITPSGTNNMVLLTYTSLVGDDKTVGGFGTKSITTAVDYAAYTKVTNTDSLTNTLTLKIVSKHGVAWHEYFNSTMNRTGIPETSWDVDLRNADSAGYYTVIVTIDNVISLEFTKAVASVAIADIGVGA